MNDVVNKKGFSQKNLIVHVVQFKVKKLIVCSCRSSELTFDVQMVVQFQKILKLVFFFLRADDFKKLRFKDFFGPFKALRKLIIFFSQKCFPTKNLGQTGFFNFRTFLKIAGIFFS
jgi:hypothetical protein